MELEIIECTAKKLYPVNILYCVILKGHDATLALALKKIIDKIKYMTIRLLGCWSPASVSLLQFFPLEITSIFKLHLGHSVVNLDFLMSNLISHHPHPSCDVWLEL